MDNFQIIDHCKYYSDDQIKEEISGAWSTHGKDNKSIKHFSQNIWSEENIRETMA
jgi:hypothetical protein